MNEVIKAINYVETTLLTIKGFRCDSENYNPITLGIPESHSLKKKLIFQAMSAVNFAKRLTRGEIIGNRIRFNKEVYFCIQSTLRNDPEFKEFVSLSEYTENLLIVANHRADINDI